MARWRNVGFLMLIPALAMAQTAAPTKPAELPTDSAAFIQKLYGEVVHYQPLGILDYEFVGSPTRKIVNGPGARRRFMPYLSSALSHNIALYDACLRDWEWKHRKSKYVLKPPIFEGGIFSGSYEQSGPERFELEKIQTRPDGTLHALVHLSTIDPMEKPPKWFAWRAEVILVRINGRLGVDNVIYHEMLEDPSRDYSLSEVLSTDCRNGHSTER